jgi:phosphatidylserine/phosphatidylglycerophosphate/cardiolipin synthase-like enzyme/uncharacterized membrane protein YdjX (TVP38/TMEM64 family)
LLNARRNIFIVGWEIDSRTRLVGTRSDPDDGYSPVLSELLSELVETRPDLNVYILLWDFSVIYAAEREMFPRLSLQWQTPPRVTLCLDDAVPFGSSQHQKLVVVDDAVAFSGGFDLTLRRWDTTDHKPDQPARVDASAHAYPPFHDVQMMVDGPAAHALALLARRRWCNAHGTEPPIEPVGDPWPDDVAPHFRDVEIGIARTQPAFGNQERMREVEQLFLDSIDRAERSIYIENQFMTALPIAERMALRLRRCPQLEILAVAPHGYTSWTVSRTLGDERIRFLETLKRAGGPRVRLVYPTVTEGTDSADVMVHSKIMIVDDKLLRVGSANLNNRSMGADTECDLVIEARNDAEQAAIANVRNELLADHCGIAADAVAVELRRSRSLLKAAGRLSANGRSLRDIDDGKASDSELAYLVKGLVDPRAPLTLAHMWKRIRAVLPDRGPTLAALFLALAVVLFTVAWYATPLAELTTHERLRTMLSGIAGSPWAALWVAAGFVVAGVVAFPVTVLIVATAAAFGPWFGFLYATGGVLASALVMYFVGALLGHDLPRWVLGARWRRVRREIDDRGMLAVAAIRLVPLAPFTLINLIAGAGGIGLIDYVAGTLLGMLPGLLAVSALGHQITALFTDFSPAKLGVLAVVVAGWIALAWAAQTLVGRLRRRES